MHRQLGQADIHCIESHMSIGNISQSRTSRHIGTVGKGLAGNAGLLQIARKIAADTASVVYFWLALYLITIPRSWQDGWSDLQILRNLDEPHEHCQQIP